jgi:hypothetical protein
MTNNSVSESRRGITIESWNIEIKIKGEEPDQN